MNIYIHTYIHTRIYINKNTNIYRWKSLEAEKTESQEIFQLTKKIDSAYLSHVRSTIIPALHIGAAIGLDSDTTVTGSCSFQTGTYLCVEAYVYIYLCICMYIHMYIYIYIYIHIYMYIYDYICIYINRHCWCRWKSDIRWSNDAVRG
jgi:hypothetical protein